MKKSYFFIAALFFSLSIFPEIKFHHLGFEDGLSQFSIRSLYQDETGAIWLATNEDVKRYNGNRFEEVALNLSENSKNQNIVNLIDGDKNGKLFFKTNVNSVIEYNIVDESSKLIYESNLANSETKVKYGREKLWIAQGNKIYKYADNKLHNVHTIINPKVKISSILESKVGLLVIGTYQDGIYLLYPNGSEVKLKDTQTSEITSLFEDSKSNFWVGTMSNGVYLMRENRFITNLSAKSVLPELKISNNYVRAINEDENGNIWIGTAKGLNKIDISGRVITQYGINPSNSFYHPSIWSVIKDKYGTIWVATYYGGVKFFNPSKELFTFTDFTESNSIVKYPIVSKIIEDNQKNVWIATEAKGLIFHNTTLNTYTHYNEENNSLTRNNVKSVYYDKNNEVLWIGTHLGGLNKYDSKSKKFSAIEIKHQQNSNSIASIQSIVPYKNFLFLGTLSGVLKFNVLNQSVDYLDELTNSLFQIKDLIIDKQEKMWIASNGIYCYDLKTRALKDFKSVFVKAGLSPEILINDIYQDKYNRLWLGSKGAGVLLFDPQNGVIKQFSNQTVGIESDYISSISMSKSGFIIAATTKGVSFLDEKKMKCYNYNTKNGFPLLSMLNGTIQTMSNGTISFGGVNGVSSLNEELLSLTEKKYNIRFDKLWLNNKLVKPNDESGILTKALNYCKTITLNHNQKILAIEIAADNYLRKNQSSFQYRIKNYNYEWANFDIKTPISIMNLSPGRYTLQVQKTVLNDAGSDSLIELKIIVKPPFYASWYAYLLYTVVIGALIYWIMSFYRSRLMLQTSLVFERKDKEQRELANQSKLRFFTNISHEFRTPITLIIGQLELLMQSTKMASSHYKDIVSVHRNALKMTRLINELLDFRKQEQGFLKLKVAEKNLIGLMHEIHVSFIDYSIAKSITLNLDCKYEKIDIWYDYLQLQKVFYNLLSNSFKNTDKNGNITIEVVDFENEVVVSIIDDGHGIAKESLEKVFERFFQDESENSPTSHSPGTGIGLALSKGIVELHGGRISVESELGKGAKFSVTLKKGNNHLANKGHVDFIDADEFKTNDNVQFSNSDLEFIEEATKSQSDTFSDTLTMLIVEDDNDLRAVLIRIFKPMYKILEAENGLIGYSIAKEKLPDIIISDIMMPVMNGNEMCSKLKKEFDTCHIPIVLLTAQSTVEQNIDGLKSGADDFISKPFNVKLLIMRCNTLLISRKKLLEKYSKQIDITPQQLSSNNIDQKFIERAVQIIEKNARYEKIDVDFLCKEMAIGRRVFFNKMKSVTGQTPNDFIQTVKFRIAAQMLKNNLELNVSEISDALGFSSPKYFGKCFREQFGISPSQMRNELSDDET
jgi:signal transduction histidine kinase/DNA-binding response OmpR family regulator